MDLRTIGKRPAMMILVSLIGPLDELNPVVIANPDRTYDWRFLVGLDVLVVANSTTDKASIKRLLDTLMDLPTEYLGLWLADRHNGLHLAFGTWRLRTAATRLMTQSDRQGFAGIGQSRKVSACM